MPLPLQAIIVVLFGLLIGVGAHEGLRLKRELAAVTAERDSARSEAAKWKGQANANYPLARQWRMGYERLVAKGCRP